MATNVCIGCGLDVDDDGKLVVQLQPDGGIECDPATGLGLESPPTNCVEGAWPFACPIAANNGLHCSATDGLWVAPERFTAGGTAFVGAAGGSLSPVTVGIVTPMPSLVINNPSPCRSMFVMFDFIVQTELGGAGDVGVTFPALFPAFLYAYVYSPTDAQPFVINETGVHSVSLTTIIPPGGSADMQTVLGFGPTWALSSKLGSSLVDGTIRLTAIGVNL